MAEDRTLTLPRAAPETARPRGFAPFAAVILTRDARGDSGESIRAGSRGAVVEVYEPGRAYAVEFFAQGLVATIAQDDLAPA